MIKTQAAWTSCQHRRPSAARSAQPVLDTQSTARLLADYEVAMALYGSSGSSRQTPTLSAGCLQRPQSIISCSRCICTASNRLSFRVTEQLPVTCGPSSCCCLQSLDALPPELSAFDKVLDDALARCTSVCLQHICTACKTSVLPAAIRPLGTARLGL